MYYSIASTLDKTECLTDIVDIRRRETSARLDPKRKSAHGQYMTPHNISRFMASLFSPQEIGEIRLLDAGAGIGSLTAAFIEEFTHRRTHINRFAVTAYEQDAMLAEELQVTLGDCKQICQRCGIEFEGELLQEDFIEAGADQLFMGMKSPYRFTHTILNPPYKKIHSASKHRGLLRGIGVETTNLYTGFLAVAIKLLEPGGELVAITPRSFCNGPYFTPFRELLLREMALRHIHIFESRTQAFKEDEVLQENIIFAAAKGRPQEQVTISVSENTHFSQMQSRVVAFDQVVKPDDLDRFIHIIAYADDQEWTDHMMALPCTLRDLGIDASTGPVVDFRLKDYLRSEPEPNTLPLIYPIHCKDNRVVWPMTNSRKPNAILDADPVQKWLYPNGYYTIVRRFSSKEERRRVVAAVHEPTSVPGEKIGFENHLNVFHQDRKGLTANLARGLAVYLNSTFYDVCFRQFNGHTQVNVKDIYNLRYPDRATLEMFGKRVKGQDFPIQETIDRWITKDVLNGCAD